MLHRHWSGACLLVGLLAVFLAPGQLVMAQPLLDTDSQPFSQQWLREHARERSARRYEPEVVAESNGLRLLSYDDYRRIVFDPDAAIWRAEEKPFQLQLFHPGFLHTTPVSIHLVTGGLARRLAFTTDVFNYHDSPVDLDQIDTTGYAGFRVHHPINTPERHEEFLVFLGASYFRAVGRDQFYGLSARGLALNTVGAGDEEFPRFSEFWIERPDAGAGEIIIHALLDSPSVTGAYQFTVVPGEQTVMEVDVSLYPRQDSERIGIAPLTSMFLFDASNRVGFDDFRNAVHDSDGLQILQADGEQVWRPLANPAQLQVSSFGATSAPPTGFGLLQRRQGFDRFNDNEARYDKRPSLWIEPLGEWGSGHVELVEIPTAVEYHDNIVAYWQPDSSLEVGNEYRFRYRMYWGDGSPFEPEQGRVAGTAAGIAVNSEDRIFVIDYRDGRKIPNVTFDPNVVRIRATTSAGAITNVSGALVEENGYYRAYVQFDPRNADLAELRVTLEVADRQWGETWLYRWTQ